MKQIYLTKKINEIVSTILILLGLKEESVGLSSTTTTSSVIHFDTRNRFGLYSFKAALVFLIMVMGSSVSSYGQTTLISPTGDGGFETGATFALNNWIPVNAATNTWQVGAASTAFAGSNAAFVSNNAGTTWAYTTTTSQTSHFYRDIAVPAGETNISLSFQWKGNGESGWDRLLIYTAPTTITPVAGTPAANSTILTGATLVYTQPSFAQSSYINATLNLPASLAGTTFRLIFTWQNDGSGGVSPGISLDDISLTSAIPINYTGTYTINNTLPTGGTNFASFTAFINALNSGNVTGPITVNVSAGQTFAELLPVMTFTGTSTNTITIQRSGSGANPRLTPTGIGSLDGGFIISGGDYITFDGIDVDASAATTTANAIEFGYLIRNASATNGAQFNTIRNCAVTLNRNFVVTALSGCIFSSVSTTQGGVVPTAATGANSNNRYYNLTLSNAQNGVYVIGNSGFPDLNTEIGVAGSGCQTARNTISTMGGISTFTAAYGVIVSGCSGTKIFNNDVSNIRSNGAVCAGIQLGGTYDGTNEIYNNNVSNLSNVSTTSTARVVGIELQNGTGTPTARVYNNYVSNVTSGFTGTATASLYAYGIFVNNTVSATIAEIDNNNVFLSVASGTPTYSSTCFAIANSSAAIQRVRGNIFVNAFPAQGATAKHVCWFSPSATAIGAATSVSNFNNMFITNDVGVSGHVGRGSTTNYNTVANWNTATTQDAQSLSVNPGFPAGTNLATTNTALNAVSGFTPQAWVTTDLSCNLRSSFTPNDIGATAFNPPAAPTISGFTPTNLCLAGGQSVTITGTDLLSVTQVGFTSGSGVNSLFGTITNQTATSITVTTPANISDGPIRVTNPAGFGDSGTSYTVFVNPTITASSNVTICSGQNTTLTASGAGAGGTYAWSPATGLSATTGDSVVSSTTTTRTYTVTGTNVAGCTGTATVTVTVNAVPTAVTVAKNPTVLCAGGVTTLTATGGNNPAPGVTAYGFSASSGTFTPLTGATTVPSVNGDTVISGALPIGFTFNYAGGSYTNVYADSNGLLSFNPAATSQNANAISAPPSNIIPFIAPLWDDLDGATGSASYLTTGTAPNRVFTFEWLNWEWNWLANTAVISFQVKLYEVDGKIEFVYRSDAGAVNSPSAATGLGGATIGNYLSLNNLGATPTASSTTATDVISVKPVTGQMFTFTRGVVPTLSWAPSTNLFTDLALTTPYTGQNVATVYSNYSNTTASQTYTATSTLGTCPSSGSATVTPNALPTITVAGATICTGGSGASLTASGANTYTWSPATGLSATTGTSVTANPSVTTTYTITGTDANGCVNTTTATVTVNNQVVITTPPSNQIALENGSATFAVVATATGIGYQWEVSTDTGTTWNPISGETNDSLTLNAVTSGMSGNLYRVVVSGTSPCAAVTSTSALLTISTVSITAQPTNQTVCSNTNATFSITATSSGTLTYQWELSTNGGTSWTPVSGETNASIVLTGLTSANTGNQYRCVVSDGSATVNSNAATLTVNDVVNISVQPSTQTVCSNAGSVQFSTIASGTGLTYQWQVSTNGGTSFSNISGANAATYTISSVTPSLSGNQYQVIVSGVAPCAAQTSTVATLTVNQVVAITAQPVAVSLCPAVSSNATFSVTASGTGLTYQWQVSTNGGTSFSDVSGETASSLNLTGITSGMNANQYRVVVTGTSPCTALTSSAVVLTVATVLNGTYTVGTGQNFETLTAAVAAYNASTCFGGNVVFNLTDATYSTAETFPIVVNSNAAAGAFTLTIKPNATATITGSSTNSIIRLNGADNVIIDGSNSGGSDKSLTIENTNTGTTSAVVWIGSASASNGATNNTVRNIITRGNAPTTTFAGIFAGSGTTASTTGIALASNSNLTIANNTTIDSQYGIVVAGSTVAQTGTSITGNTIGSATPADYIGLIGLFVSNLNGATVSNNNIFNIITGLLNPMGINIQGGVINSTFNANRIDAIRYTGTGGYGGKGININTGNAASNLTLSNNMISNIGGDGWSAFESDAIVGIRVLGTSGGLNIFHNTVNLSGSFAGNTSGTLSAAMYFSSGASALNVRNNIFRTSLDNTAITTDKTYAIYTAGANTAFTSISHNNYVVSGTPGVLGFLSADQTTLPLLTTAFGQNTGSVSIAPVFVSATDLHLDLGSNATLDNLGTPLAAVTTDFDGATRSGTTPDMGADEFTTLDCTNQTLTAGTITSAISSFCTSTTGTTVSATGYTIGVGTTYQWEISTNGGSSFTPSGTALTTYANLSTGALSATTQYRLAVSCNGGSPELSNVVTITRNIPAVTTVSPNTSICNGNNTTLTAAGSNMYAWTPSATLSAATGASVTAQPTTTTTYTVTGTDTNNCTSTATVTVTVDQLPTAVTVTNGAASVCVNSTMALTATGGIVTNTLSNQVVFSENFNGTVPGWSVTNGGASPPQSNWAIATAPFTDASGSATFLNFTTPNGGGFALANPDAGGSGSTTTTILTSPAFSTVGLTSANLTFEHVFQSWSSDATVRVEVSTDGGTNWVQLVSYLGVNQGTVTANAQATTNASLSLASYLNQADVRIRYNYVSTWGYFWIIDNVRVIGSGTTQTQAPITWTPTTNLFTDPAGTTAYTGQNLATVYVKPTSSTPQVYTATATNGACAPQGATTVTATDLPTFTLDNATICSGGTATLNATGSGLSYVWTPGNLNTATVSVSPTATTTYSVVGTDAVTGCQSTVQTTVTVNQPVVISGIAPAVSSVTPGQNTTFTVSATGTGLSYQWQVNTGSGFVNLSNGGLYSGALSSALTISNITVNENTYEYRCIVTGTSPCTFETSAAAVLNVDSTGIDVQPTNQTVCVGSPATFSLTASNVDNDPIAYAWEYKIGTAAFASVPNGLDSVTGLTFSGEDSNTLSMTGTTAINNGILFRCVLNGYIFSSDALLTVNTTATIDVQPVAQTVCNGAGTATFSVTASNATSYQWQVSTNGGSSYTDVSGATSASLTITNPVATANGNLYRVFVGSGAPCSSLLSSGAILNINNPAITTQPVSAVVAGGNSTTYTVAGSGLNGTVTYQWQRSTTLNGTYADVTDATPTGITYSGATSATLTVQTSASTVAGNANFYRCIVTNTLNGNACSATSTGGQLTVNTYCTPSVVNSTLSFINDFATTGGTTNITNTASGLSTNGYGNFTATQTVTQILGGTVNFTTNISGGNAGAAVWVDWNRNGIFETTERVANTTATGATFNRSFTVPMSASLGSTRMRVLMDAVTVNPNNPCVIAGTTTIRGEVEDYTFVVAPQPQCSAGALTTAVISSSRTDLCQNGTATLSLTGLPIAVGYTYQWFDTTNTAISGATNTTYTTPALTGGTYTYYCVVSCSAGGSYTTNTVTLTVSDPQITGSTPAGRCGTGTLSLAATANGTSTITWYGAATGGIALGSGTSFTTPSISTTTTYFAEANGGSVTASGLGNGIGSVPNGTGALVERGIVFTANQNGTIVSAQYYSPTLNVTNTVTVRLVNNTTGVQVGSNLVLTIPQGPTAAWYTMNLNLPVVSGTSYRLLAAFSSAVNRWTTGVNYATAAFNNLSPLGVITSGWDSSATATSYNYFHNITVTSSCSSARTAVVATVTPQPTATIAYSGSPYCANVGGVTPTLTGTNAFTGGAWSSTDVNMAAVLNPATGSFDTILLPSATAVTYPVTYTIPAVGDCSAAPVTANVTVRQNVYPTDTADFTYSATTVCTNGGTISPTLSNTNGGLLGTFTASPTGLSLNATTGAITLATSTPGTYTVTNTVTECSQNIVSTFTITVSQGPAITASPASASACATGTVSYTAAASGTGVVYTWEESTNGGTSWNAIVDGGIYSNSGTATLTLTGVTSGMNGYQYRAVVTDTSGCGTTNSGVATLSILSPTALTVTPNATICPGSSQVLTATGGNLIGNALVNTMDSLSSGFTVAGTSATATLETAYQSQGTGSVRFNTTAVSQTAGVTYSMNSNLNLAGTGTAQLTFSHQALMEGPSTSFDYGFVEYSTNGGTTWVTFPATSYVGTADPAVFTGGNTRFTTRSYANWIAAFTGTGSLPSNALWQNETFNIPVAALTSQFRLRFRYTTDSSANYYGWLLDNVRIATTSTTYTWSPATGLSATTGASVTATPSSTQTYTVTADNVAVSGCSTTAQTTVTVNPTPTFGTLSGPSTTVCAGSPTTFNVTGLLPSTTSTLSYTINNGATQTIANIVSDASGNASFNLLLSGINNGQPVTIVGVTTTSTTPNCSVTVSSNSVTINVQPSVNYYPDADGDGFGNPIGGVFVCTGQPSGFVLNNTDCNDNDITRNATFPFYADTDGDGVGAGALVSVCAVNATTPPTGFSLTGTDCDPNDNTRSAEFPFYADTDGDGVGAGSLVSVCAVNATTPPAGFSLTGTDCAPNDNTRSATFPFFVDNDGDGLGFGSAVQVCAVNSTTPPTGYATNNNDCDDNSLAPCNSIVNLKLYIEGYYSGAGLMTAVRANQGVGVSTTDVDNITVELRNATTGALVTSTTAMLQTNGTAQAVFNTAPIGSFYLVVKHRSAVQTWSATPQTVGATALTYDFSDAANKAFGDNMRLLDTGVYGLYNGDLVQDDFIDLLDFTVLETDYNASAFGDYATDLNGDGFVDLLDFTILETNYNASVFANYPTLP
jgi:hypothetical protein